MNATWCATRQCWVCFYPGTRDVIATGASKVEAEDAAVARFRVELVRCV